MDNENDTDAQQEGGNENDHDGDKDAVENRGRGKSKYAWEKRATTQNMQEKKERKGRIQDNCQDRTGKDTKIELATERKKLVFGKQIQN